MTKKKKRKSNMNSKFIINSYQLQAIVIDLFITPSECVTMLRLYHSL